METPFRPDGSAPPGLAAALPAGLTPDYLGLPGDIWSLIFSYCPHSTTVLWWVCRAWRRLIPPPVRYRVSDDDVYHLALEGRTGALRWLIFHAPRPRRQKYNHPFQVLEGGILGDQIESVRMATRELGAVVDDRHIRTATRLGSVSVMSFLMHHRRQDKWEPLEKIVALIEECLETAAAGGHLQAMRLAHGWGARNVERALREAARNGHVQAMELAYCSWGARNLDDTLYAAASQGRLAAMKITRTWGAQDLDSALRAAALGGERLAMKLLLIWGATDVNEALIAAARFGHVNALRLALDAGATNTREALEEALGEKTKAILRGI